MILVLKTRVFELAEDKYDNKPALARAMGISLAQLYRVKKGERHISEKFIIGACKAFPRHSLNELFYVVKT